MTDPILRPATADDVDAIGSLFHQGQMQANFQFRVQPSQRDSLLECTPRHK